MRLRNGAWMLLLAVSIGCDPGFDADYIACDEFAGVGVVPMENIAGLVPADYTVIEPIPGQALVVAQSGSCDAIVVDGVSQPGIFAQFGVGVVPPLAPGNGDFYQLAFATDHPQLAARMHVAGVDARYAPTLSYQITAEPQLSIDVPKPTDLAFSIDGPITLPDPMGPPEPTTVFNYYAQDDYGDNILQQNVVEGIRFGSGAGVVLTAIGGDMQDIVGGNTLMFPFFSNPEIFDTTELSVDVDVF